MDQRYCAIETKADVNLLIMLLFFYITYFIKHSSIHYPIIVTGLNRMFTENNGQFRNESKNLLNELHQVVCECDVHASIDPGQLRIWGFDHHDPACQVTVAVIYVFTYSCIYTFTCLYIFYILNAIHFWPLPRACLICEISNINKIIIISKKKFKVT